jgi:hypothetical protein
MGSVDSTCANAAVDRSIPATSPKAIFEIGRIIESSPEFTDFVFFFEFFNQY